MSVDEAASGTDVDGETVGGGRVGGFAVGRGHERGGSIVDRLLSLRRRLVGVEEVVNRHTGSSA